MRIILHTQRRCNKDFINVEFECYFSRSDRKFIRADVNIEKKYWDASGEKVKHTHPDFVSLNTKIKTLRERLNKIDVKYTEKGITLTRALFDHEMSNFKDAFSFNEYCRQQLEFDKKNIAKSTARQIESVLSNFDKFCQNVFFTDINVEFIRQYHLHLLKTMKKESTSKNHKKISKYLKRAVIDKLIEENPYNYFKITPSNKRVVFLTEEEIERIRNKKITIERLGYVRDRYLFLINTGMEFADQEALIKEDVITINGKTWIVKQREKIEEGIQAIPLFDEAIEIINKYNSGTTGRIFRPLTNQRFNSYLKELADICDINKNLTTIIARHTFATQMLTKGLPIETVSHILGHKNIKTTRDHYAKLVTAKVANDLKRLNIKGI